ncbi:GumC family protein [Chroogloeocystis siderophila]|jgi:succinoglycan biosynthesis transport protein ExoP|uniref:Lipopolysaccharide biosynthesis protein n=1 Tax=Chroogloeocystis siderophila 5.2 s.c.1 TaxID=247279 RepID=A0A1U7HE21_9CHRO|nr:tyrosine-protein kinase domain-containing protein [Chroogloeocystis siderophila]OKH21788.1 lipopolysaccharide biosynthesis protein [Chroogloeocystis siderophila 5.2 s.c.1]
MNHLVNIIRRHWLPLLLLNGVVVAATLYAIIHTKTTVSPVWKANAELNLPQPSNRLDASLGTLGQLQNTGFGFSREVNPLQIQLSILTSDTVMERVLAVDPEKNAYLRLSDYKALFTATPQQQSTIIAVEARASSPDIAYKRLNNLINIYQLRLNELRRQDTNVREEFSQEDLKRAQQQLAESQVALANFQQQTGLTDIVEQTRSLIGQISNLRTTYATVLAQAGANQTQANVASQRLGMSPQQAMNSLRLGENKEYQATRQKLSEVETALAEARSRYTDESPQVQSLLSSRQELQQIMNQQIATAVPGASANDIDLTLGGNGGRDSRIEMISQLITAQNSASGLQQQANLIANEINRLNTELNNITRNRGQLLDLQRRYEIAEGIYKSITAQIEQAKTNPFNVYPNIQTLDAPSVDPKPEEPSSRLAALGGILAALFGSISLILFLENRNPMLKPEDLQQVEFPILGRISRLRPLDMERSLSAEVPIELQRLASAVLMLEHQRLLITSSTAGEGKTTVTLGLALALVNCGFRVLIVDGDLKQAELSRRLGHPKANTEDRHAPVSISLGLDLLPAPAVPSEKIAEFFARGSFAQNLNHIQTSGGYDYVLVDSPPLGLASETNLMSAVVQNVLFVVRAGKSDRYSVLDSFEQLSRHNAHIMGLVVNCVESSATGYRYGRQRELIMETEA